MTTHQQALAIVERAVPGVAPSLSLLVRAISVLESHYGDGWGKGASRAGEGSHNWGAITAGSSWRGATFEHSDSRYNPDTGRKVEYSTKFRAYPTAEAGARDLVHVLQTSHAPAVALAASHRWGDVSRSMGPRGTRFYLGVKRPELAERDHRGRLLTAIRSIAAATGESVPGLPSTGASLSSVVVPAGLILLGLALLRSSWR